MMMGINTRWSLSGRERRTYTNMAHTSGTSSKAQALSKSMYSLGDFVMGIGLFRKTARSRRNPADAPTRNSRRPHEISSIITRMESLVSHNNYRQPPYGDAWAHALMVNAW
jgi:hypothetical protein